VLRHALSRAPVLESRYTPRTQKAGEGRRLDLPHLLTSGSKAALM
jgi:hypothetical protein